MRIRFTADAVHETGGRGVGTRYVAGEIHDLRDDQARRWLRRGLAVSAEGETAAPPLPEAAVPAQPGAEQEPAVPFPRHLGGGRWSNVPLDGGKSPDPAAQPARARKREEALASKE